MSSKREDFLLPKAFKPEHYRIHLTDIDTKNNTFQGHVTIQAKTIESKNVISLNIRDLEISKAIVTFADKKVLNLESQSYNDVTETVSLKFAEEISTDFCLDIEYKGHIQTNMSSFYRSDYKDSITGENKCTLSTQFEATEARRCFPCFDEPDLKATFQVVITASPDYTVLANMPLLNVVEEKGFKTHTFHTSPLMSTYLVAWALGYYDFIEAETEKAIYPTLDDYSTQDGSSKTKGKLPIRIYTAKGKSQYGKFALSVAKQIVDYFSELFEIPYPLPKLDLLCVEAYSHNAMENFSLITFRPSALLLNTENEADAELGSEAAQKVAYVVCHEIAHQWFGNLVTMKWWDELWLNEGFATWVGYHAISRLFPHWDVDSKVMIESHEVALGLDSLKESHAVKMHVNDPKEIEQAFDTISYLKGCSVLEMISGYFGEEVFLRGVALYLKRNKFGNATMEDLFTAIGEIAKVDFLPKVNPWILEVGYPVLTVKEEEGKVVIDQKRFLTATASDKNRDTASSNWWVPLLTSSKNEFSKQYEISEPSTSLELDPSSIFINTNGYGFYRVKYESAKLLKNIFENISNLSSRSKMSLISDICNTDSVSNFFNLLKSLSSVIDTKEVYVWQMIFSYILTIRTLIYQEAPAETIENFDRFALNLIESQIDSALEYIQNPASVLQNKYDSADVLRTQFYEAVLLFAGHLSHKKVIAVATSLYTAKKIDASNRAFVLQTILSQPNAPLNIFEELVSKLDTLALDELENTLTAIATVTNPILYKPCLDLLLNIEPMNVQFLTTSWAKNPCLHKPLLDFVLENHSELFKRLIINPVIIGRFVAFSFQYFSSIESLNTLKLFFSDKDVSTYDNSLRPTLEKIEYNAKYVSSNLKEISDYFK
ncbi:hypothetical protein TBLA_0H01940 [Henningerozyma blattae CBS 6284]|uniref:Aminopeptidase n=1 Tax=Henningerozyma blattae (strain ATCC 34711 / CBS 6284 / DSM 70876 / NBRC 10599 / NRRL Y-10934 / UCD 77-7) TaxID=1071380 RepID=I2H7X8_HENB6|nr:hypothetical protein TBLA_0H01940 [Tetrapisispora blattae CBS 6284]CCH62480.1 hypothetical protein TBLA_0H01940 [Tetrapisispora blattae CBS 6284]